MEKKETYKVYCKFKKAVALSVFESTPVKFAANDQSSRLDQTTDQSINFLTHMLTCTHLYIEAKICLFKGRISFANVYNNFLKRKSCEQWILVAYGFKIT